MLFTRLRDLTWASIAIMAVAAIVISAIGFYLGLFLCAIVQRPKLEKWFYLSSQLVTIATLAVLVWVNGRTDTPPVSPGDANQRYADDFGAETPAIRIACDSLKLKFTRQDPGAVFQIHRLWRRRPPVGIQPQSIRTGISGAGRRPETGQGAG